jgi:glyoxylase-like metal-dependent hydrolase (beta-lactamase superfamily II)
VGSTREFYIRRHALRTSGFWISDLGSRQRKNLYDPHVLLISAHNPSPWTGPTGNNTYLIDGAAPTLIDAGVGHPVHVAAIERALAGRPLAHVLITHGHTDHVSGVPALGTRWPGVQIRKLPPEEVIGATFLDDGEVIQAGDTSLRAVSTPGHSPDHCCFVDDAARQIYCGDLIRAGGTIVIAASRGGDLRAYLQSLERVRSLAPRRLLPGHGAAIDDPASAIDSYVRHRAERDAQVLEALKDGLDTPASIAGRIYVGLDPSLERAAVDTVLAHLVKLEAEGRVARNGERWGFV